MNALPTTGWKELDSSDGWLAYPVDEAECLGCKEIAGPVLHEDPNTGHDRAGWVIAFWHEDIGGLLCEDCLIDIEASHKGADR